MYGSIKRAGSPVGNLTGGSVTYSNNLEKIETIRDDGLIEGADPTIAALTGRVDVRFADTTLIDLAAGGTPVDLEFSYTLSAQSKLVLTAHEVDLPKPKLAVEGPGGVQASFDFRGAKNDVAGRMLTVTLTNDLDGTVYGWSTSRPATTSNSSPPDVGLDQERRRRRAHLVRHRGGGVKGAGQGLPTSWRS
jgi:hypothetical protein